MVLVSARGKVSVSERQMRMSHGADSIAQHCDSIHETHTAGNSVTLTRDWHAGLLKAAVLTSVRLIPAVCSYKFGGGAGLCHAMPC